MQAETLTSFLPGADDSEFPLENIPFGIASRKQTPNDKFAATRIGTSLLIKAIGSSTSKKLKTMASLKENYSLLLAKKYFKVNT